MRNCLTSTRKSCAKSPTISRYLADPERLKLVIREELEEIVTEFGDERRTEITASQHDLTVEDLITEEDRVVTISHGGYAKDPAPVRLPGPAPRRYG